MPLTRDEDIAELLRSTRTIAMIGASDRPTAPSYGVMRFLQNHGYRVIPVNPQITGEHVHGEYVWRELSQIGEPIDMVDIFRRPRRRRRRWTKRSPPAPSRCGCRSASSTRRRRARRSGGPQGGDGPLPRRLDIPRLGLPKTRLIDLTGCVPP
jgi:hypothetical protein